MLLSVQCSLFRFSDLLIHVSRIALLGALLAHYLCSRQTRIIARQMDSITEHFEFSESLNMNSNVTEIQRMESAYDSA